MGVNGVSPEALRFMIAWLNPRIGENIVYV